MQESSAVEFKRVVGKDFCKEVVAFVNTEGGTIYIGIEDDGTVIGVEDTDAAMLHVASMIETNIEPEVRRYVSIRSVAMDGKDVVAVEVEEGDRKPYCIAQKGYVPSGVYVRVGTRSSRASNELIRSMIVESDGEAFERRRCREQNLTFRAASHTFERANIAFESEQMRSLGIMGPGNSYTNLGLVLSDQNPFEVKCAVYNDATPPVFLSRKEFTGSLFQQIDDVLEYLEIVNQVSSRIDGFYRVDRHDYPPAALREALLNSLVHRDYGYSGPVILNFYPDRAEFVSLGGLTKGLTVDDIQQGVSSPRNPLLAGILYRLRLVEGYGTGIRSIMDSYNYTGCEPILSAAPNSFVTILPNLNWGAPLQARPGVGARCIQKPATVIESWIATGLGTREEALLEFAATVPNFSRQEAEAFLCVGRDATLATLNKLLASGELVKVGHTRATRYARPNRSNTP